jgi:hypothetical protein
MLTLLREQSAPGAGGRVMLSSSAGPCGLSSSQSCLEALRPYNKVRYSVFWVPRGMRQPAVAPKRPPMAAIMLPWGHQDRKQYCSNNVLAAIKFRRLAITARLNHGTQRYAAKYLLLLGPNKPNQPHQPKDTRHACKQMCLLIHSILPPGTTTC